MIKGEKIALSETTQLIQCFKKAQEKRRDVESLFHSGQWILASPLVCFGAKGNTYGWFTAPIGGNLAAAKLVHQLGYVSCDVSVGTN